MGIFKSKTKVDREEVEDDENSRVIRGLLDQAGHIGRGHGTDCVGYAVVFFYKGKFTDAGQIRAYTAGLPQTTPERLADVGVKELARKMMQRYGRTPKLES